MTNHRNASTEAANRDAAARRRLGLAPITRSEAVAIASSDYPEVKWNNRDTEVGPTLHPEGRQCEAEVHILAGLAIVRCQWTMSIYNEGPLCYSCERRYLKAEHAAEAAALGL